ncbi:MAG: peptidase [Rhodoferax sp.]|nr:peptidase [Betaproteobacteria bacterium]NCN96685.1 peptidase [Rhodoferax sp.]OIP18440.1 MAG: peptidase [Comamonadaceae bacterium CG2_30_57_122]PIZ22989.1 MAG: peptidase [Comamonadaceae bacterium CG_4_10_14_0_8_um_filter_57_29]PJC20593.1 MAG: peptidase [Comamonadaceae bacterium CG_4_9_14_0_8_um_filter_57_21]
MKFTLALIAALLLGVSVPVWAEVSRDAAASLAQQASGGRVLAVEKLERQGQIFWRVKVLTAAGEVRVVLVDAASGRVR